MPIIPTFNFEKLLKALMDSSFIDSTEATHWASFLEITPVLIDYKKEAHAIKDVGMALSLAVYHATMGGEKNDIFATYWLCDAIDYSGEQGVDDQIDISSFFESIETIGHTRLFRPQCERLTQIASQSQSIKKLKLDLEADDGDVSNYACKFLKATHSVEELCLENISLFEVEDTIHIAALTTITEGLASNRSVKVLKASNLGMGDEGLSLILQAVESNTASKIESLEFRGCLVTEKGAKIAKRFIRRHASISIDVGKVF